MRLQWQTSWLPLPKVASEQALTSCVRLQPAYTSWCQTARRWLRARISSLRPLTRGPGPPASSLGIKEQADRLIHPERSATRDPAAFVRAGRLAALDHCLEHLFVAHVRHCRGLWMLARLSAAAAAGYELGILMGDLLIWVI